MPASGLLCSLSISKHSIPVWAGDQGLLQNTCIVMQVKAQQQGNNQKVVSQAMTELLWRDFFRFTSKKYASLSLKQSSPDAVAVCA